MTPATSFYLFKTSVRFVKRMSQEINGARLLVVAEDPVSGLENEKIGRGRESLEFYFTKERKLLEYAFDEIIVGPF